MSKNLTRKGLALGAALALGSTLFAGVPAQAAGELNLKPSVGTTYGSIIGESFTLQVTTNPGYSSSELAGSKLKFNITNPSKGALTITAGGAAGAGVVNAGAADNSNYVVTHQAPATADVNRISISTGATATSSVNVQAWVDSDFNSVIDAGEWTSATQTIVFNKASEVSWTTEFTAPVIGDLKFLSYVSATPNINMGQLAGSVSILFTQSTDSKTQVAALSSTNFDSATGKLKFNDSIALGTGGSAETSVLSGKRYSAQALFKAGGSEQTTDTVGSAVAYAVSAATISRINAPAITNSDNVLEATAPVYNGADGVATVRSTATTVPVSILVQDSTPAALKDTKVTVYIAEKAAGGTDTSATSATGNYDSSTFAAGGKTLQDTSSAVQVISFEATTNADGKVLFDLTASAKAGDGVAIWASAQGVNVNGAAAGAVSTAAEQTVYNWADAAPTTVINTDLKGTNAVLKQAAGSTFSLNFTVLDQFGAAIPTADKYRVAVSDGSFQAGDANQYAVTSAGKATVSFTLAATATGTKTYTYKAQTKAADGNFGTDLAGSTVSVVVGTSNAASSFTALSDITTAGTVTAALSATATNTIALSTRSAVLDTVAFVAGDKNAGATNSVKGTLTTGVLLAGQVTDATTAGTYSTVSFSGTNLNFVVGSTLYAAGTVTVQTDASGNYAGIRVLSNKAGKQTLTITAGTVSKSYVLDFGLAAKTTGKTLTVDAPATVTPGTTLLVKAKLVDAFGNGVSVDVDRMSVTYTGPGLLVGELPKKTDENGELSFRVLLGAADSGTATVVVKASTDDDTTFDETGDLAVTKAIAIAAPVVVVPEVKTTIVGVTKAVRIRVENAKGEEVEVKFGSKTVAVAIAGTNSKLWVLKTTKGKKSVKVYVDGDLVAVKTVTVK